MSRPKPRLAILASGEGTNYSALVAASQRGDLRASIVGMVTDTFEAPVINRAMRDGIRPLLADGANLQPSLRRCLDSVEPDLVALAGFNRILKNPVLSGYPDRILNTHSAELPRFGGKNMYSRQLRQAVIDSGVDSSVVTVHLVDDKVDHGRVLGVSAPYEVRRDDTVETLSARILPIEHDFYWRMINQYLEELDLI